MLKLSIFLMSVAFFGCFNASPAKRKLNINLISLLKHKWFDIALENQNRLLQSLQNWLFQKPLVSEISLRRKANAFWKILYEYSFKLIFPFFCSKHFRWRNQNCRRLPRQHHPSTMASRLGLPWHANVRRFAHQQSLCFDCWSLRGFVECNWISRVRWRHKQIRGQAVQSVKL